MTNWYDINGQRCYLDRPTTAANLEALYAAGMPRKDALVHGAYYQGTCRNASLARWHAPSERFLYRRYKFGHWFIDEIAHPVDEPNFDVFVPVRAVEAPPPEERIADARFA